MDPNLIWGLYPIKSYSSKKIKQNLIWGVNPIESFGLQLCSGLRGLTAAEVVERVVGLALQHVLLVGVRLATEKEKTKKWVNLQNYMINPWSMILQHLGWIYSLYLTFTKRDVSCLTFFSVFLQELSKIQRPIKRLKSHFSNQNMNRHIRV
jgi:hypothetical protein